MVATPKGLPLAPASSPILRELQGITGAGKFLFPSIRSAASSMLNESGLSNADAIERQLAHVDNESVRRAYARANFWEERVRMMAWWAERCEEMRRGGVVIPLRA